MGIFNFLSSFTRKAPTQQKEKEKVNILPFCNTIYQTVANSSMQEQYAYIVKNQNVQAAIKEKINYLFNADWDIETVDGELDNTDIRIIEELKAHLQRENTQGKNFIRCLQNVMAQKIGLGIGFMQRTPNTGGQGSGNFFYDDLLPGSVADNIDSQGNYLNPPHYYVNGYNARQPLEKGSILKFDSMVTNLSFYPDDFRALRPVSPLFTLLFLLIASDFVDAYEAGVFKNGILPGSVLETPEGTTIDSPEMKQVFDFLMHRHAYKGGQESSFKYELSDITVGDKVSVQVPYGAPLPLPGGYSLKAGLNPADFSKPELKRYTKLEIFGALGFPIELIPGMERNSSLGSGRSQEEALNSYEQTANSTLKDEVSEQVTKQLFRNNEKTYRSTGGRYGFKTIVGGVTDLSRYKFVLKKKPNKIGIAVMAQFNSAISQGIKFTQREARGLFLPYMSINDTDLLIDSLDEVVEKKEVAQPQQQNSFPFKSKKIVEKAKPKEKPMKIYNSDKRGYNTLDKQIKSLENQTNVGIESIIRTIIEKYMNDVKNNAYDEEKNNYDLRKVAKIKLKDINKLRLLLNVQTEKAWNEGEQQQLSDPNIKDKSSRKKYITKDYKKEIVEIIDGDIILKIDENTEAGTWDYSQLEETIFMISEQQTDLIAAKLLSGLRDEVTRAIRQNIPVESLVAEILSGDVGGTLLAHAFTEARTALSEARQQSRFKVVEDLGAEYFQIDATLDDRTTEICQKLNGIIIKADELSEFAPGLPPYHFNCRTEINAIFREDLNSAVRELGDEADNKFGNEEYIQDVSATIPTGFEG